MSAKSLRRRLWLRRSLLGLGMCLAATGVASPPNAAPAPEKVAGRWVVHEWGTFLSVQGANGRSLGGMVDSEERLPKFVYERNERALSRSVTRVKMETPVTYFYSDRIRRATVRVDMKGGLLTHWYPTVSEFGPELKPRRPDPRRGVMPSGDSHLLWRNFRVVPEDQLREKDVLSARPPAVSEDEPWNFARRTDSALLQFQLFNDASHEAEKYLFYRGLGKYEQPLSVAATESDGKTTLTAKNAGRDALKGIFLVDVSRDGVRYRTIADIHGRTEAKIDLADGWISPRDGGTGVKQAVARRLTEAGLYAKEAQAMVDTWESSYFRTPGLRMLYLLPRETTDELIPIKIEPAPNELVRVMVGRVEILTPGREREIAGWFGSLDSKDEATRGEASKRWAELGRLQEPVLHRLAEAAADPAIRAKAVKLLASKS